MVQIHEKSYLGLNRINKSIFKINKSIFEINKSLFILVNTKLLFIECIAFILQHRIACTCYLFWSMYTIFVGAFVTVFVAVTSMIALRAPTLSCARARFTACCHKFATNSSRGSTYLIAAPFLDVSDPLSTQFSLPITQHLSGNKFVTFKSSSTTLFF